MYAAISALQQMQPCKLIVAAPVAPASTVHWLSRVVDEFVCLDTPEDFYAVGQFYDNFMQVEDHEVIDLLQRAEKSHDGNRAETH